jgi:hypothetical protein
MDVFAIDAIPISESLDHLLAEPTQESVPESGHRHQLPAGYRLVKDSVLGGLHHEYRLVKEAA